MIRDASTAPGWYGKLSSLGDFASRRLEPAWIESCDEWLARSMTASRVQLGGNWLQTYLSAPVWRFAWAPGVADHRWWFGVLMPSCDNVGRYFPLIVAQPRDRPPLDRIGLDHLDLWWAHVARAAVQTLQDHVSLDDFEAELMGAPPWPTSRAVAAVTTAASADRVRIQVEQGSSLVDVAGAWASQEMMARLSGNTLWWPLANGRASGAMTVSTGLPEVARFTDLLTGHW
ncbi:type VI secretion system-associated protein TagF [Ideonella sp. A 288]|uniref:type VI secretion system-associated protein TagF n=1 Tax=Ideonella sp. A 288 TaxID=1962181 RepID=UPI000B4B490A|nr:type VI secretion system-associated protein TagF [Ideonella sp. A 288]